MSRPLDHDLDNLEGSFIAALGAMRRRKADLEEELPRINLSIAVLEEKLADISRERKR